MVLLADDKLKLCKQCLIEADKYKLSQVIRNFISNALKFTPEGGTVTIKATIVTSSLLFSQYHSQSGAATSVEPETTALRVEVIDTGHGIAKVNICLLIALLLLIIFNNL